MKSLRYILLMAATLLVVASCWKDDKHRNKYSFALDCDFEYYDVKFGEDSIFVVENVYAGGVVHFAAKVDDEGSLMGGICLAGGVDPTLSDHEAKTPFHTVAHQYFNDETTFAVFHETGNMPEKTIDAILYNDDCLVQPQYVLVNNTHPFVRAARYGTGLAGGAFAADDWASVTFSGFFKGAKTGEAKLNLADFTQEKDSVVTTWTSLDLTPLGNIDEMQISLASSREDMVKDVCFDHMVFKCNIEY